MHLTDLRWEDANHLALITAYHILHESLINQDLHMLMVEGSEPSEEYVNIVSDLGTLHMFFQMRRYWYEYYDLNEENLRDSDLTDEDKHYQDYLKVIRELTDKYCPKFSQEYHQHHLSIKDIRDYSRRRMNSQLDSIWKKAMLDLENSESETVRLWRGVFESDEGQFFLRGIYANKGIPIHDDGKVTEESDTNYLDTLRNRICGKYHENDHTDPTFLSFDGKDYGKILEILIRIPDRIARDRNDLLNLSIRANTIAYGCGTSIYDNNHYVMDSNKEWRKEYLDKNDKDI